MIVWVLVCLSCTTQIDPPAIITFHQDDPRRCMQYANEVQNSADDADLDIQYACIRRIAI